MDGHLSHPPGLVAAAGMWLAMAVVMMAPVALPWVRAYERMLAPAPGTVAWRRTLPFAAGYGVVWAVYSVVMALAQTSLSAWGRLVTGRVDVVAGAVVLVAAGAFQFTSLKAACLTHCRNPLSFFLARWHDGPAGGLRLGLSHGVYCLGCCWLLMATAFALGVMSLVWMAVVMAITVVEQVTPAGPLVGRLFGAGLIVSGLWRVW